LNINFCSGVDIIPDYSSDSIGVISLGKSCLIKVENLEGWQEFINISNSSFTWFKGFERIACEEYKNGNYINCLNLMNLIPLNFTLVDKTDNNEFKKKSDNSGQKAEM
jgi:hypothetical protein